VDTGGVAFTFSRNQPVFMNGALCVSQTGHVGGQGNYFGTIVHPSLYGPLFEADLGDQVVAIDNAGRALATSGSASWLYTGGSYIIIPGLGGSQAVAKAVNDSGEVVGHGLLAGPTPPQHAFVYQGGTTQDLNTLISPDSGWVLQDAVGVNDLGQIAGNGLHHGRQRAFILTPMGAAAVFPGNETPPSSMLAVPNPSSGSFEVRFARPLEAVANLAIYSVAGREVRDQKVPAGASEVKWDGRDTTGARVPTGAYYLRLSGGRVGITRVILVR
jgi:probable HAF family extracellular repeat protein